MRDDRSAGGAGVAIAAVAVVVVLLICGGGALAIAGFWLYRVVPPRVAAPPPIVTAQPAQPAHVDILSIEADGTLLWNDAPVSTAELRLRLDELKTAAGPPRSVIVRSPSALSPAHAEVLQLLNDRQVGYIVEGGE